LIKIESTALINVSLTTVEKHRKTSIKGRDHATIKSYYNTASLGLKNHEVHVQVKDLV